MSFRVFSESKVPFDISAGAIADLFHVAPPVFSFGDFSRLFLAVVYRISCSDLSKLFFHRFSQHYSQSFLFLQMSTENCPKFLDARLSIHPGNTWKSGKIREFKITEKNTRNCKRNRGFFLWWLSVLLVTSKSWIECNIDSVAGWLVFFKQAAC